MSYKLFVDATCQGWQEVKDGVCEGEILVKTPRKVFREKRTLKIGGLRQFINRFELMAVQKAIKIGRPKKNFIIYSDSKVAVAWAKSPFVKWIPREENRAGHILEYEKEYGERKSELLGIYSNV